MLNAVSIAGYMAMVGALIGLFLRRALFSSSPLVIAIQIAVLLLFAWARFTFRWRSFHAAANPTKGGLVTSGPYRYIRHPIYTAMCVFAWAGIAAHWSWLAILFGGLMMLGAVVRIFIEEKLVTTRYPDYVAYAAKTWRMVPFVF